MGGWHSVSRQQFETYYTNQESGIGVWVSAAELLPSPIALCRLRQNWGHRWQPPQQIQQLTDDRMAALNIAHQPNRAQPCHRLKEKTND
jgi:hypothetical protein